MAIKGFCFKMLPERCLADVVALTTTPAEACWLSLVAKIFRSAADSDVVWRRFLPSDYKHLISRAEETNDSLDFASKKKLYLYLCDHPLIIDGGSMSFWLDKWSGSKCFMIAAKGLKIAWGDTPQHWRWIHHRESRFAEVAELVYVHSLEINGTISTCMLSPNKAYGAYFIFKQSTSSFGFKKLPIYVSIGIIGGESIHRTVYFDPEVDVRPIGPTVNGYYPDAAGGIHFLGSVSFGNHNPNMRKDGWLEIELGEYFNPEGENRELEMTMKEVRQRNRKSGLMSGLIVQGIEIRPKGGK